jgi:hypothetical protein
MGYFSVADFTMNRVEAKWLLLRELVKYRRSSYGVLSTKIGDSQVFELRAPSGNTYQVDVDLMWDDRPGGAIRIFGSIDDGGWRAICPLSYSDLKAPPLA